MCGNRLNMSRTKRSLCVRVIYLNSRRNMCLCLWVALVCRRTTHKSNTLCRMSHEKCEADVNEHYLRGRHEAHTAETATMWYTPMCLAWWRNFVIATEPATRWWWVFIWRRHNHFTFVRDNPAAGFVSHGSRPLSDTVINTMLITTIAMKHLGGDNYNKL